MKITQRLMEKILSHTTIPSEAVRMIEEYGAIYGGNDSYYECGICGYVSRNDYSGYDG